MLLIMKGAKSCLKKMSENNSLIPTGTIPIGI